MKLVKQSLGQEATALLRQMLLDGHFTAGQRMVEGRIASELGISRTPLREALHRLAQEGILEKRSSGGYQVRQLNRREVEDAIAIRSMLESHAAMLAATRATSKQIAEMRNNLEQFASAHAAQNIARLVKLNMQFHTLLRTAAHAPLLFQLLEELDGVVERMLRPLISSEESGWSDKDHVAILDAVAGRDPEAAAAAMRAHVEHGKDKILSQLPENN